MHAAAVEKHAVCQREIVVWQRIFSFLQTKQLILLKFLLINSFFKQDKYVLKYTVVNFITDTEVASNVRSHLMWRKWLFSRNLLNAGRRYFDFALTVVWRRPCRTWISKYHIYRETSNSVSRKVCHPCVFIWNEITLNSGGSRPALSSIVQLLNSFTLRFLPAEHMNYLHSKLSLI